MITRFLMKTGILQRTSGSEDSLKPEQIKRETFNRSPLLSTAGMISGAGSQLQDILTRKQRDIRQHERLRVNTLPGSDGIPQR